MTPGDNIRISSYCRPCRGKVEHVMYFAWQDGDMIYVAEKREQVTTGPWKVFSTKELADNGGGQEGN
jgi:hypothetical protein